MKAHNDTVAVNSKSFEEILDNASDPAVRKLRQRCISGGRLETLLFFWKVLISRYTHHLDRWLEQYPQSKMVLIDGEQLKEDPVAILNDITKQLGLPSFDFGSHIRFSPSKGYFCKVGGYFKNII